jgi:hypothetical protein
MTRDGMEGSVMEDDPDIDLYYDAAFDEAYVALINGLKDADDGSPDATGLTDLHSRRKQPSA